MKFESVLAGEGSMLAFCNGIGTKEDENGVAPAENGTFGLFVLLTTIDPLLLEVPKDVTNDPEKNRLAEDALVVMDNTLPVSPPNGAAVHAFVLTFHTATAREGCVNEPPTHT